MAADTRPLHSMSLRGVIIPALLVFAAVVWWAGRGGNLQPVDFTLRERSITACDAFGVGTVRDRER